MKTRVTLGVLLIGVLSLVLASMPGTPTPVQAAEMVTVVYGRYLTLTSIGDPDLMKHLAPDRPVQWQVGVQANPPQRSRIDIGISAQGTLAGPGGLQVDVRACTVRWVNGTCSGIESAWLPHQDLAAATVPVDAYGAHLLGWMDSTEQRWLLIRATLPEGAPPGSTVQVRIHAWGTGGEIKIDGTTAGLFANTGWLIALAAAAVLGGMVVAGAIRRRRSTGQRS